MNKLVIVDIG